MAKNARAVIGRGKISFLLQVRGCTVCTDVGLESRCDSMIGSVRPKSSKRKAKGVPKPKHKNEAKLKKKAKEELQGFKSMMGMAGMYFGPCEQHEFEL